MRVHGTQINIPVNPFIAAAENAVAKQRAADVRKKLAGTASAVQSTDDPDQAFLMNQWTGVHNYPAPTGLTLPGDEYRAADSGKDSDFG